MRETTIMVQQSLPQASEIQKLEKKSLVSYIYIGSPVERMQSTFGTKARIQLNDAFSTLDDIPQYITSERSARDEKEVPFMTASIKADQNTKMGIVTDVKQELRKANALKISYSPNSVFMFFWRTED